MTTDEIQSILVAVLHDVQTLSGRPSVPLPPSAKPIGDLQGFDSLTGVEATVMVEEKLGCGELKVESIFVSEDGKRALTVKEIAERISKLLTKTGGTTQ